MAKKSKQLKKVEKAFKKLEKAAQKFQGSILEFRKAHDPVEVNLEEWSQSIHDVVEEIDADIQYKIEYELFP